MMCLLRYSLLLIALCFVHSASASRSSRYFHRTYCREGQSNKFRCPDKADTIYVADAVYGRSSNSVCRSNRMRIGCTLRPTRLIKGCMKTEECSMAVSNWDRNFGDPCPGYNKYLTVTFECRPPPPAKQVNGTEYYCRQERMNLECPAGKTIHIIDANYGRTDERTCGNLGLRTECIDKKVSLKSVQQKCEKRRTCGMTAWFSYFSKKCAGVDKYLSVTMECQ